MDTLKDKADTNSVSLFSARLQMEQERDHIQFRGLLQTATSSQSEVSHLNISGFNMKY